MIFTDNIKRTRTCLLIAVAALISFGKVVAQKAPVENSVFWEVSGQDLKHPSYLFGTFHLMGSRYIDSLTHVVTKFNTCKTVVGELLLDSTMTMKMMAAARLDGTTLDQLLSPEHYKQTAEWLKELSGYDLRMFNGMNPMTIQLFLMTMLQQQYFPMDMNQETPMDMYFQNEAKQDKKKLVGLETFDVQVNALFLQFSPERQAEMLSGFVKEKEKAKSELITMNRYYREGNLTRLQQLLTDESYSESESKVMLDDRNKKWMEQIPGLMKEQQTFVAVGALHLAGENGLVNLLRTAGYTVKPAQAR